ASLSVSAVYIQRIVEIEAIWTVYNDGTVNVHMDVKRDKKLPFLPRFGLRLFLPENFSTIDYLGYGPNECYVDKRQNAYYSHFTADVCDLHEDYIKPQENGSHWGCTRVSALDPTGFSVQATGDNFSFNASLFTQEELGTTKHNYELETSGFTVLCLDSQMSGIGSGSCGPQLKEKYQLSAEKFTLDFDLYFGK
ncbi:MAG: beta-galactosidase small subunit, partial [Oscillospiraceae bacterium]